MKKLYGTVVPIVTPFDESGKIDVGSLKNLAEYIIESGLQCIYPCGTTGEMCLLSEDERKLVDSYLFSDFRQGTGGFLCTGGAERPQRFSRLSLWDSSECSQ